MCQPERPLLGLSLAPVVINVAFGAVCSRRIGAARMAALARGDGGKHHVACLVALSGLRVAIDALNQLVRCVVELGFWHPLGRDGGLGNLGAGGWRRVSKGVAFLARLLPEQALGFGCALGDPFDGAAGGQR